MASTDEALLLVILEVAPEMGAGLRGSEMLVEALAAVSLHCTAEVRQSVRGPRWNSGWTDVVLNPAFPIRIHVDYERGWGYVELGDNPAEDRKLETSSILVTDQRIRVIDGFFGFHRIDDLTINRSTGELQMVLINAADDRAQPLRYRGSCEPGEAIELPERPVPRF